MGAAAAGFAGADCRSEGAAFGAADGVPVGWVACGTDAGAAVEAG